MKKFITNIKELDDRTINRFLEKVFIKENDCWIWDSTVNHKGYGRFPYMIRTINYQPQAHRVSYIIFKGKIPIGKTIHHKCRNKLCVNPDHLEPRDNISNIMEGNCWSAKNKRKTHCMRGHKFNKENTYIHNRKMPDGRISIRRHCRVCSRMLQRNWRKI